jgi:hydroxymethylpyrimidine pyrophosphatase-like HAD family hydrolase
LQTREKIRLFVCDWEGCVTEPEGGGVPWRIDEIGELSRLLGVLRATPGAPPFVLCTGRQFPYGEAALQAINAIWEDMPSIMENGAGLYYPRTRSIRVNPAITPERLAAMGAVREEAGRVASALGGQILAGKEFSISVIPPNGIPIEDYCEAYRKALDSFVKSNIIEQPTHSRSAVDITPPGVNKGSGVRFLSQATNIPLSLMVGIGDTAGDVPMLSEVGYPCAPANADDNVKKKAQYVSPHRTTRGVIDIVRRYSGIAG